MRYTDARAWSTGIDSGCTSSSSSEWLVSSLESLVEETVWTPKEEPDPLENPGRFAPGTWFFPETEEAEEPFRKSVKYYKKTVRRVRGPPLRFQDGGQVVTRRCPGQTMK